MNIKQLQGIITYCVCGAIIATAFNYAALHRIMIPDECYYHDNGTTAIFDLFYDIPLHNGYHPFPTLLNVILTVMFGLIGGVMAYRVWHRQRDIA